MISFELWHSCPIVQSFEFWPLQKQTAWTKQSTGWLNTSSIRVLLVFNDSPLLIIQASGITEEKFFSALHKRPSFSTGGPLWAAHSTLLNIEIRLIHISLIVNIQKFRNFSFCSHPNQTLAVVLQVWPGCQVIMKTLVSMHHADRAQKHLSARATEQSKSDKIKKNP